MIDNKEIEFDALNVITTLMLKHDKGISAIEDILYITSVIDMVTPLSTVKKNFLQAGLFPGCVKECYYCAVQSNGYGLLKEGIQRLMDEHVILIQKVLYAENLCRDLSVI